MRSSRFWRHLSQFNAYIFHTVLFILACSLLQTPHVALALSGERMNNVLHSLAPPSFPHAPPSRPGVGYKVHLHGQCSMTPDSRWKIWNLLKHPRPSRLNHLPVKQQLIGRRDQGADWSEGRDAAAKSFICLAEIVYQWSSKRREHLLWRGREGFSQEAFNALGFVWFFFGLVPFFYWLNSRGDQHTEAKWSSSSASEGRSPVISTKLPSLSTLISVA